MARVSQQHLDARRRQILDGAGRCFARNGFHASSMQDVLAEVGLSAGAVYRYFGSKDELIEAIADEIFTGIRAAFADATRADPLPTPDILIGRVMRGVLRERLPGEDEQAHARLIVQVWTETLRNDRIAAVLQERYAGLRASWAELVELYRARGLMPEGPPADHVARTLIATTQGFITQQALFGGVTVEMLENGLGALISMERPATG
ncbi:TetR/AcrR family transcriptional regulator [Streptomyces sp. NPDC058953]|uniref:TetR/AcrR family transcriptional regulator n=1 Tax=unclassified Streptomyces TaxID=2593676 RepID=UPI003675C16D